jgi:hypothetical protein
MVEDLEVVPDEVDDPPAGPQAGGITGRFRAGHDQARQLPPLRRGELWRSAGRWARPQAGTDLPAVRAFPSTDGAPIHPEALGHDMHGDITLEQVDCA